jgi:hypothetical protein
MRPRSFSRWLTALVRGIALAASALVAPLQGQGRPGDSGAMAPAAAGGYASRIEPSWDFAGWPPMAGPEGLGPAATCFDLDAWLAATSPLVPRLDYQWQILPDGILFPAGLANPKESRLGTQIFNRTGDGALWDSTLGGRIGLIRWGTPEAAWPQGWQVDVEGSAQVRLDPDENLDLRSTDYRVGVPLTYGYGPHRWKLAYYHLCAHLGDEFVAAHPQFSHVNFVRDALTLGYAFYVTERLRLWGEVGWAFSSEVSEPWELLFGIDYAPARPTGWRGAPFAAIYGHLRQELNFSGNLALQAGWAWRADQSTHLLRLGFYYYNGASNQYSFFRTFEQQIGGGLWYDF